MSLFTEHPRLRWMAPLAGLALAAAGTGLATSAGAQADLEPRTAEQVIAEMHQAALDVATGSSTATGMSGTVVQTADLGLPDIAGLTGGVGPGGASSSELSAAVTGTHTWRVWYAGPEKVRLALVGTAGESDVIRNGREVWTWSSATKTATRYQLPEQVAGRPTALPTPSASGDAAALAGNPPELARRLLELIGPSTEVGTPQQVSVAGRAAYELSFVPRTKGTLVAKVTIAVDGEHKVPLRVRVFSTRADAPAVDVAFTSVDFAVPEARQFDFTPPPGTTVREGGDGKGAGQTPDRQAKPDRDGAAGARPSVVGSDWASVLVGTMPDLSTGRSGDATDGGADNGTDPSALLGAVQDRLPAVSGSWGSGRLLQGTLFSLVITNDGRFGVGAVEPQLVYDALAASP